MIDIDVAKNELIKRSKGEGYFSVACLVVLDYIENIENSIEEKQKHLENLQKVNEELEERIAIIKALEDALELLKKQEEKPFRCKNCSYHRDDGWCNEHRREVKETDYCSFGAWNGR